MHPDRPALGRHRDAVARGELDAVLATSPDRPARDDTASIQVLEACARAGRDVFFARWPRPEERTTS